MFYPFSCMEKMYIYIKMRYQGETWLNASLQYVQRNLVGAVQYVPSTRIVARGSVIAHLGLPELFVNALFVQQIHANMVEPVWGVKPDLDSYAYALLEEEVLFVKMVIIK